MKQSETTTAMPPKRRGPPTKYDERLVRKDFKLRRGDFEYLQSIAGTASAGVRMLIDEHIERNQHPEIKP